MKEVPELNIIADIEPHFVFGDNASEVTPQVWVDLAKKVAEIYADVDGVVILHGIDTMIYTGAMLSFMLQNLAKPVVLTGSPLIGQMKSSADLAGSVPDYRNLGIRANLINALQLATMDIAEVVIAYGSRITRANQTIKSIYPSINFFEPYGEGLLGKVDFGIKLFDHTRKRSKAKLKLENTIDDRLCTMRLTPISRAEPLGALLSGPCRALLIRTYGTKLFPDSFTPYLRLALEKGVPIVAHNLYAVPKSRDRDEFIVVNNMTYESTLAKSLWILGKKISSQRFREFMYTNIAEEFSGESL